MNKVLRRSVTLIWVGALVSVFSGVGMGASYTLEVSLDFHEQTISGVEEVTFNAEGSRVYFLLLANLAREENPYLSKRMIDATYPSGFDPASTTIETVKAMQNDSEVTLGFRLLALPPVLQIYSLEETVLAVDLPAEVSEPVTLHIHFTTRIPRLTTGDQGIDRGIVTWRFGWYPYLIPHQKGLSEANGVLQLDSVEAFPLEFPSSDYTAQITLSEEVMLACGADHVEEILIDESLSGESESLPTYQIWNDAPARTLAFAAGPDYDRFTLEELSIPIEVFFLPGHAEEARLFATYARDILDDYEKRFGPYPRTRLTIVENPNQKGLSMAADGIVWLSSLFFTHRDVTLPGILNRFCEFILAHEIAHQWWGIGVGVDFNAENWLSEGMAQYLAVSYFESRYGESEPNTFEPAGQGILENLIRSQFGFFNLREHEIELPYLLEVAHGFDEAIIKPLSQVKYENATVVRLYDKGYLVARAIAAAIGKETFERGLREAGERFRHQTIHVQDLQRILEETADRSLEELFRVWLLEPGSVDYTVEITSRKRTESGYRIVVKVRRDGGAVQPVMIEATLRSGEKIYQEWDGASAEDTLIFETEEPLRRVTIDPHHLLPDRERLNNNAPIKFITITSENAFPLDAYLIRPDPLSKEVSITYLNRLRLTIGEGTASTEVFQGRNHHFFLTAGIEEGDLSGTIAYTFTTFAQPKTGSAGTFWEPDASITLSGHRLVTDEGALSYLHLSVSEHPSIQHSRSSVIGLDLTPAGAGRVSITAFDEAQLFPHIYLQGTLALGMGFGDLPRPLLFDLNELISFGRVSQGKWISTHFPGNHKLYGRLAVEFPASTGVPFNLVNVMMLDKVRARAFIAGGESWTSLDEFGKTTPNVEVGVEALFDLSAIGGLLPIRALVGYATPIQGEGIGVFYFGFSL